MIINKAGILKTTLIDYPGKIASTLFLPGCNLRCPFCHNRELVLGEDDNLLPIDKILKIINKRKNIIQGVCISGGEPLIHNGLPDLIREIRKTGVKIKIDTNGLLPEKLADISPDYVSMDIKTSPLKYNLLLEGIDTGKTEKLLRESVKLIIESGSDHEFRTTLVPGIVDIDDIEIIAEIANGCRRFTLNKYRPQNTLDPSYEEIIPFTEDQYTAFSEAFKKTGIKAVFRGL